MDDKKIEKNEDSTKYGEFIPSYFAWISSEEQKKETNRLEKITKNKDKRRNINEK